jgi:hypothetical protein
MPQNQESKFIHSMDWHSRAKLQELRLRLHSARAIRKKKSLKKIVRTHVKLITVRTKHLSFQIHIYHNFYLRPELQGTYSRTPSTPGQARGQCHTRCPSPAIMCTFPTQNVLQPMFCKAPGLLIPMSWRYVWSKITPKTWPSYWVYLSLT